MTFRGLGRQWKVSNQPRRPRRTHGRGSHDECYHFCRPGRARALDQGGRARCHDRRGQIRDLRLRRGRRGRMDPVHRPRGQMRLRVRRHRLRPAEEARRPGRRLRHRRGVQDDEARRRQAQAPDPAARRHASKGVRRLVGRRAALLERGVHKSKANVATARELACWCWAVGSMAEGAR